MSLIGIKTRSNVVQGIRRSLQSRGYEEYIPQLMTPDKPIEPTIFPFSSQWDRNFQTSTMYFATSPEVYLKQILASGEVQKCFCISHAFRNLEGEGRYHRPEFQMAEWYKKDIKAINKNIIDPIRDEFHDALTDQYAEHGFDINRYINWRDSKKGGDI